MAPSNRLWSLRLAAALILLVSQGLFGDERSLGKEAKVLGLETASGVRFGIWPGLPQRPAPTLFVFAGTIAETLGQDYNRQSANSLSPKGYMCVAVDLPCHGKQRRPGEPDGLSGWRYRCDLDEDFIAELNGRLRAVLDHLIERKLTDPERVAACGTSRGGFAALHFAAVEPRVKCVAAFAPVTDLTRLAEFKGAEPNPLVQHLSVERRAGDLSGRAVWLVIGDRDERVSTDSTVRLARQITAEALQRKREALVDLHVIAEPRGHTTPAGSADQAAGWIDRQLRFGKARIGD
jgi:pimeloyl-ACP methyl ester carboxylesterase